MIIVTGTVELESTDEIEKVKEGLLNRARRSRNDEGCIDYVFSQNMEKPTELRVTEVWESEELLQAHLAVPDPEFNEILANAKISKAVVTANEISNTRTLLDR